MNKFKDIFTKVAICFVCAVILSAISLGIASVVIPNFAVAEYVGSGSQENLVLVGTKSGTATTTAKTSTSTITCYTQQTNLMGQVDIGLSYTPWDTGNKLEFELYSSYDNKNWYLGQMQTNSSATGTLKAMSFSWAQPLDATQFTASTTYTALLNRNYSNKFIKMCLQEKVASGKKQASDIFIELFKSKSD